MKYLIILAAASALLVTAASAAKRYPLNYCVVTDNELGSMGKTITKVYDGQEIKFCCKPCVAKFEKNPAKYLSKLP
ncbi:MAG TPA: hypothetical protein PLA50_19700 [Bacteroidia bacterium]|nr:hypothetical protein [Bacteroidia bacterium]